MYNDGNSGRGSPFIFLLLCLFVTRFVLSRTCVNTYQAILTSERQHFSDPLECCTPRPSGTPSPGICSCHMSLPRKGSKKGIIKSAGAEPRILFIVCAIFYLCFVNFCATFAHSIVLLFVVCCCSATLNPCESPNLPHIGKYYNAADLTAPLGHFICGQHFQWPSNNAACLRGVWK